MKKRIYPYLIVLCCCGMATVSLGVTVNCAGVFYSSLADALHTGIGDVSLYLTVLCISAAVFSPYAVKLADKADLRLLIVLGAAAAVLSCFGMSCVTSIWQLYGWAALLGVAAAPLGMAMITYVIGNWFYKSMGLAIGVSMSFSGVMGAVMSPVLSRLIEAYGWQMGFRVEGCIALLALLPAIFLVRLHPEEIGMEPYGKGTDAEAAEEEELADAAGQKNVFRSRKFILVCLVSLFGSFIAGFGSHLSRYATAAGLASMTGAYMISAAMIGNMASKLILGMLCDSIGSKKACCLVLALATTGLVGLYILPADANGLLMIVAFLIGTAYSVAGVGVSNLAKSLFGAKHFGSIYSYVSSLGIVSSAFSYSLIGYSFDLTGAYTLAMIGCAAMAAVSIGCIFWAFKK